jgi:tRNA-specific 2-thiouridylase
VRGRARALGLAVAARPESQDICFVPDGDLRGFLERNRAERELASERFAPGPVVAASGERLGTHPGSAFFTVGQRRGLGVAGGRALYVTAVAPDNTLVVGGEEDLLADGLDAEDVNWLVPAPAGPVRARAQIRYRSLAAPAEIVPGASCTVGALRFDELTRAIAPGQSVVFYDGDRLIGGDDPRASRR